MVFKLLFLILFGGVALLQSTQGLFSAMLMMVFTICCAAGAIGTHEWVAINWVAPYLRPDYAYAVALGISFGLPLVLLRLVADRIITRACLLPIWVDRIGGAICGIVTAVLVVGVMSHAVQNLPFGPSIIGFSRVGASYSAMPAIDGVEPTPAALDAPQNELILTPDRKALALGSMMSAGVFSNGHTFFQDHADLTQTSAWINAVPTQVTRYAPAGSITIVRTQLIPFIYDYEPAKQNTRRAPGGSTAIPATYDPIEPADGSEFHMVRVKLHDAARDKHRSHIFTLRQFRLVGQDPQASHNTQYLPVAIQDADATQSINRHFKTMKRGKVVWPLLNEVLSPRAENNNEVEIVFELPLGFQPSHLAYKRGAYADVTFSDNEEAPVPAQPAATLPSPEINAAPDVSPPKSDAPKRRRNRRKRGDDTSDANVPNSGRGGNIRGVTTKQGKSFFGNELPMTLTAYQQLNNVELSGSKMVHGHLVGEVSAQDGGQQPPVTTFDVPDDKRLLQLNTTKLHTRSGLGKALANAASTVQNYLVEDDNGNKSRICGKYAIATVNGKKMIEVQYFKVQAGTIGGVRKFEKIKDANLKKNYELVLLFLVEPGAEMVRFTTGGAATRADDLTTENLVAPD